MGRGIGRGDDICLRTRKELGQRQRDVARAWRQVNKEEIGVVPKDVGQELLKCFVQHRTPPDHRLILASKEAHRDTAHTMGLRRNDHVVDHRRGMFHTEHPRDRETPDISVDNSNAVTALRQGNAQIGCHRRLAHAALARCHGQHPGGGVNLRRRSVVACGAPGSLHHPGLLGSVQLVPVQPHVLDAVQPGNPRLAVSLDGGAQRAAGGGQCHGHVPGGALAVGVAHHAQVDDVVAQLGIHDAPQDGDHRLVIRSELGGRAHGTQGNGDVLEPRVLTCAFGPDGTSIGRRTFAHMGLIRESLL